MSKFEHLLKALPLAGAIAFSACGGTGGGTSSSAQSSAGFAVGEPAPTAQAPVVADFVTMARASACSRTRNRVFIIDQKQVFWDRADLMCADSSYSQQLFGATPQTPLCSYGDSIAGPRESCTDDKYKAQFDTMRANLDKPDLGLGAGHKVEEVAVLPVDGSALTATTLSVDNYSGVTKAQNVVIRDEAALRTLWDAHNAGRTAAAKLPTVDFNTHMVLGVFLGTQSSGCSSVVISYVGVSGGKIVVDYQVVLQKTFAACTEAMTAPMVLAAVPRQLGEVTFTEAAVTPVKFTALVTSQRSAMSSAANEVIKDASRFGIVWAQVNGNGAMPPAVDFSKNMVILVAGGEMPTACNDVQIGALERIGHVLHVTVNQSVPGAATMCAQTTVSPAQMIVTERSDDVVVFDTRKIQI
ncbi:MAG: hypothetical protein V4463_11525 [Pseudomonadota bacterium]